MSYPQQYLPPQLAAQQEQLRHFWQGQMQEIHQVGTDPAEFKNHQLPLARIKKVGPHLHALGSGLPLSKQSEPPVGLGGDKKWAA